MEGGPVLIACQGPLHQGETPFNGSIDRDHDVLEDTPISNVKEETYFSLGQCEETSIPGEVPPFMAFLCRFGVEIDNSNQAFWQGQLQCGIDRWAQPSSFQSSELTGYETLYEVGECCSAIGVLVKDAQTGGYQLMPRQQQAVPLSLEAEGQGIQLTGDFDKGSRYLWISDNAEIIGTPPQRPPGAPEPPKQILNGPNMAIDTGMLTDVTGAPPPSFGAFAPAAAAPMGNAPMGAAPAGGFMGTSAPNGATWGDYCGQSAPQVDGAGQLVGPWAECVAWAKYFEFKNPGWENDPQYEDGPCGQVINAIAPAGEQYAQAADALEQACQQAADNGQPLPIINQPV